MSTSCPYCKLKPSYNKRFKEFSCSNKCIVISLGTLKQSKNEWEYLVEQAIKQEVREMTRKEKKKLQEQEFDDNILKIWRENGVDASLIGVEHINASALLQKIVSVYKELPVNNAIFSNTVGAHKYDDKYQPICIKIILHESMGDSYCDCYFDDNSKSRIYRPDVITYG